MDSKLKTGLISLVALVGGYSFLSKNFNKSFEADTFMASSGKRRPVAMRANKIKHLHLIGNSSYMYEVGGTAATKKFNEAKEKIFKDSIVTSDYGKYLTEDQFKEWEGLGLSRYSNPYFGDIFTAFSWELKKDFTNMLYQKYHHYLKRDKKICEVMCNKIAGIFDDLSAKGIVSEVAVLNNTNLNNSLESLFNFLRNLKIPSWSFSSPFSQYGEVILNKDTHIFTNPFNAMSFLKLISNSSYSLNNYWDNGGKDGYTRKIRDFGNNYYAFLAINISPVKEYAIDFNLDESELKQLGAYYLENDFAQRYQLILGYIKFFNANPTVKYVAQIRNKGEKCYDTNIGNLNEFDKIKGLTSGQYGYESGVLIKTWNNELMSEIFTEEKHDVLLGQMLIKLKKIVKLVNRKANVAGNRQEKLLDSVADSNKESVINALDEYFSNPEAEHFQHGISAPRAYISLISYGGSVNFGIPLPRVSLNAAIQEVIQNRGDGKYEIHKKEYVNFHELPGYDIDIVNDVTISKDLKEMVLEEVNNYFKHSIENAEMRLAKQQSALNSAKSNHDKYLKLLD
tara:strand:+ start:3145 stop:4842 length:1698 start_codon:yes stop_codon:yes gene_type:complete